MGQLRSPVFVRILSIAVVLAAGVSLAERRWLPGGLLLVAGLALGWPAWFRRQGVARAAGSRAVEPPGGLDPLPGPPLTTPPTVPWAEPPSLRKDRDHTA